MVTIDDGGGGGGGARPTLTIDSLRADLAETKLLVHDLHKQLQESKTKLEDSESRNIVAAASGAGGGKDGDDASNASMKAACEAQMVQRDTIRRLEREVNGLNTKTRMLEVHNDLLIEQEKVRVGTFQVILRKAKLQLMTASM
jgi:polyhydroxyalkanoate synthesis regulator phasin